MKKVVAMQIQTQKALVATDNNEDLIDQGFDAEPVTYAMIDLTGVETNDWSIEFVAEHMHIDNMDVCMWLLEMTLKVDAESQETEPLRHHARLDENKEYNIIPSGVMHLLDAKATRRMNAVLWHRRLGHVNFQNITIVKASVGFYLKDILDDPFLFIQLSLSSEECTAAKINSDDDIPKDGIFSTNSFDAEEGGVADYNNMDPTIDVPSTPTLRIHKIHPQKGTQRKSSQALADESWMDVKSAFLYGNITEEVYVKQPPDDQLQEDVNILEEDWSLGNARNKQLWLSPLQKPNSSTASCCAQVHTDDNVADLLTKGFDLARFNFLVIGFMEAQLATFEGGYDAFTRMLIFIKSLTFSLAAPLITRCWLIPDLIGPCSTSLGLPLSQTDLLFDDENGVDCFPKQVIWDTLRDIGYEGNLAQLTFSKPLFSPQWKYLIHVLLHCLSPKSTSWEQFGTNIASALVGLATNQKFNFSLMILNGMLGHISNGTPFLMYPRFVQLFLNKQLEGVDRPQDFIPSVSLPSKVFTFMRKHSTKFSCRITPLTPSMLEVVTALAAEEEQSTSPHSRAESSARDAHGSPTQSAAHSQRTASLQGTATSQRTADFQGTAEPHDAASIPKSPNDYTPTDASQTSGGDEGLLDIYALNREVKETQRQTLFSTKQIIKLKAQAQEICPRFVSQCEACMLFGRESNLKKQK
ncbi:hypothetical protein Tco_0584480 [Tanacetum coccineum]